MAVIIRSIVLDFGKRDRGNDSNVMPAMKAEMVVGLVLFILLLCGFCLVSYWKTVHTLTPQQRVNQNTYRRWEANVSGRGSTTRRHRAPVSGYSSTTLGHDRTLSPSPSSSSQTIVPDGTDSNTVLPPPNAYFSSSPVWQAGPFGPGMDSSANVSTRGIYPSSSEDEEAGPHSSS